MKKHLLLTALLLCNLVLLAQENFWRQVDPLIVSQDLFVNRQRPAAFKLFQLNETGIENKLREAPSEKIIPAGRSSFIIAIPTVDGQVESFRVVDAPVMDPVLAAKYPGINSYAGVSVADASTTIRFSISPLGFHGMILSTKKATVYIDPLADNYYIVVSRADVPDAPAFRCLTQAKPAEGDDNPVALRNADDGLLRTYRLALCATGEFSAHWLNGTETTDAQRKAKVLAAMNNHMTRVNGIYERDFGVRMVLIANNDAVIYLNSSTDPFTTSGSWNNQTQSTCDGVIGSANYDVGHMVTKAPDNGNAGCIGCVCTAGSKGSGWTAYLDLNSDYFVVDYLTHEMGHQFGGNHTFTHSNEGTIAQVEPGSGSTIMGYAGITGATTDVQPHSDDYFHAISIQQVTNYIKSRTCNTSTVTGNTTPTAAAGADYVIPRSTPFNLTGTGTDADAGDQLSFCWEQNDVRATGFSTVPSATATAGPQFRSYLAVSNTSRTFPRLSSILDGTNTNKWEVLPSVARTLNFRFTVRDNHPGGGNNRSDDMIVSINGTAGPFAVTAPNTAVTWNAGTSATVTWSVNSTNLAPVNCANVNILLSTDGGLNFPIVLAANTPNDGTQSITVPANSGTTNRVKVEAVGNIFFDISNVNFTISGTPPACAAPAGLTTTSITTSSATVSWSAVSGAVNYDVDYKTSSSGTWTPAATATTSLTVNLSGLSAATLYDWRVRANCSGSSSIYSQEQFTTNSAASCNAPSGLNATSVTQNSANVNWSAVSGAVSYDVDYKTNASGIWTNAVSGTTSLSASLAGLSSSTLYDWRVRTNCSASSSVYATAQFTTLASQGCSSSYDNTTNGTTGGAATIPFNTGITGLINPRSDNDYYRFVVTTDGTATLTLTTLPANYDLRLYSSNGTTQLGASTNNGTNNETITYTFTAGTYYARVNSKNASNATSCYTLTVQLGTATRELIVNHKISAFPNPVSNMVTVKMEDLQQGATIRVFDIYGKMVLQQAATGSNTDLDLSRLSAGVYTLRVMNKGSVNSLKIVKD